MSTSLLPIFLLYKFGVIVVGAFIVYLGYRLLVRGAFEASSDFQLHWGDRSLTLSRAAPGSLFALFGAGVMVTALLFSRYEHSRPVTAGENQDTREHNPAAASLPALSDEHIRVSTPAPRPSLVPPPAPMFPPQAPAEP
jgi:hypothetical protein